MTKLFPDSDMTDEQLLANFEAWLLQPANQDERLQALARTHSPLYCYRDTTNPRQHYALQGYNVPRDPSQAATLVMVHGADSALPGVTVHGMNPTELVKCDCGKWRPATRAQLEAMDDHMRALHRARALAPRDGDERSDDDKPNPEESN